MTLDAAVRILALALAIAAMETVHGIARMTLLAPRVGKELALKLSIVSGSLLAFAVCWFLVPGIGLRGVGPHLALGAFLVAVLTAYDVALGLWLLRRPLRIVLRDFDPRTGNYLSVGLLLLAASPALVHWLRAVA